MSQGIPLGAAATGDYLETLFSGGPVTPGATAVPSGFYGRMQATATKLLKKFSTGTVIYWTPALPAVDEASEDYNPLKPYGDLSGQPSTEIQIAAAVFGFSEKAIDGEQIKGGDVKVLIDAAAFPDERPKRGDILRIDGTAHIIIEMTPIPAAGTTAIFKAQARTA